MSNPTEYFADFLTKSSSMTEVSGRLLVQENAEKLVASDIAEKLRLQPDDTLLEIGCGVGNVLIPLSFSVRHCTGIDHEKLIAHAAERFDTDNIDYVAGQFPNVSVSGPFDKILVYSVLAYMKDETELFAFIDKALTLLSPSGRMMLGDIACIGNKERFAKSEQGKEFQKQWEKMREETPGTSLPSPTGNFIELTDEIVLKILLHARQKGFHSYVVEQDPALPFGNSREDIIIVGSENQGL